MATLDSMLKRVDGLRTDLEQRQLQMELFSNGYRELLAYRLKRRLEHDPDFLQRQSAHTRALLESVL